ncbi:MAG: hypothetical protein ACK4SL_04715 [Candidatus Paceibacteria bacterium]
MEDLTLFQMFIFALVGYGSVRIIRRRFKKKDAIQLQEQAAVEAPLVISSYRFVTNKVQHAVQEAVVLSVYGTLLVVILGILVIAAGLVPFPGLGALLVNAITTVVTMFPLMVLIFSVVMIIASRRMTRPIPQSLVSKKYSLATDLYIDTEGIEGAFALPWQKIYRCEEVSPATLKISFYRSPYWLTKLIGADTLRLAFTNPDDLRRVLDMYTQVKQ